MLSHFYGVFFGHKYLLYFRTSQIFDLTVTAMSKIYCVGIIYANIPPKKNLTSYV